MYHLIASMHVRSWMRRLGLYGPLTLQLWKLQPLRGQICCCAGCSMPLLQLRYMQPLSTSVLGYNNVSCTGPDGCKHLAAGFCAAVLALASGTHAPHIDAHRSATCASRVTAGPRNHPCLQPDLEQRQQPASPRDGEGSLQP